MSSRIKLIAAALVLVAVLVGVFSTIAFAADPSNDNSLPACCQQQLGQAQAANCCGVKGTTSPVYQGSGGCCGR